MPHPAADGFLLKGNQVGAGADQFANAISHDQQLEDTGTPAIAASPTVPAYLDLFRLALCFPGFARLGRAIEVFDIRWQIGFPKNLRVGLVPNFAPGAEDADQSLSQHGAD